MTRIVIMWCGIIAFLLTACNGDEVTPPSTEDVKEWNLDANMDTENYRPGDNFYMYCIGTWYKNTDLNGKESAGLHDDAATQANEWEEIAIRESDIQKLYDNADRADETVTLAEAAIKERLSLIGQITTKEEGWKTFARLIGMGYDNVISFAAIPNEGLICLTTNILTTWPDDESKEEQWLADIYEHLGESSENARQKADIIIRKLKQLQDASDGINLSLDNLREYPEMRAELVPLQNTHSRATTPGFFQTLAATLGISEEHILATEQNKKALQSIEDWTTEELKAVMEYSILSDYRYASTAWAEALMGEEVWDWIKTEVNIKYLAYPISYAYATRYVSPELKAKFLGICEEMRTVFKKRLTNLDWMSESTKQRAIEKLEAMQFNVGYPDEWIEEALPDFSGNTFVENVMQLRQAHFNLLNHFAGKSAQEGCFNIAISSFMSSLSLVNCFYYPEFNCLCIYPAYMLPPMYNEQVSDAYNYAEFAIVGHETTYGFDNNGSNYDKNGDYRNWWTVMDKMAFTEKCQSLIDCYNLLEIMPEEMPGQYCDGENTLGENIADLGGVEIAHQAYVEKLQREGFHGEELEKQERRFYQGWAEVWRQKYTSGYAQTLLEDVHALPKERVNGVMMNCDRWYELFDVQWGDMLYLAPELRTHIW